MLGEACFKRRDSTRSLELRGGWEIDVLKKEMWTRKSVNETNSSFQLINRPVEEHGKKAEGDSLSSRSAPAEWQVQAVQPEG